MKDTKVVLLTTDGISGNLVCSFLRENYTLAGVVLDTSEPGSAMRMVKRRVKRLGWFKVFLQLLFQKGIVPLLEMESKSRKKQILSNFDMNALKKQPNIFVPENVNDDGVIDFVNGLEPRVVMVCGTRLIKKKIIEGIEPPLINIHVGVTPKYRGVHGGYWALANGDPENCGVTVHLVDTGIDTGGIICQSTINPSNKDNFCTYTHLQIIEGLKCIKKAIEEIEAGSLKIKNNYLESKLYYHPTITTYLYHRIFDNVK